MSLVKAKLEPFSSVVYAAIQFAESWEGGTSHPYHQVLILVTIVVWVPRV